MNFYFWFFLDRIFHNFPKNKWAKLSKELFDNKLDTNKNEYSKLSISNFFINFFE